MPKWQGEFNFPLPCGPGARSVRKHAATPPSAAVPASLATDGSPTASFRASAPLLRPRGADPANAEGLAMHA